jgi:hypothetical protein
LTPQPTVHIQDSYNCLVMQWIRRKGEGDLRVHYRKNRARLEDITLSLDKIVTDTAAIRSDRLSTFRIHYPNVYSIRANTNVIAFQAIGMHIGRVQDE